MARAREQARKLKRDVDLGGDPLGELLADRQAPTVEDLCLRFGEEHLPKLRPSTRGDCEAYIRRDVLPALGKVKVADVTHAEIDALHRKISKRAPYAANKSPRCSARCSPSRSAGGGAPTTPRRGPSETRRRSARGT